MLIWILAVALLALGAATGYFIGAIRTVVVTIGLIVSAALASQVGGFLRPLFEYAFHNEIWLWILPPLTAFLIISGLFIGISFFVHRKIDLYFKYHAGEFDYVRWDRLNRKLGAPLGLLTGTVALLLVGWVIYAFGYLAVQLTTDHTESSSLRLLAAARHDMRETGLDKPVAAIDFMPARYYQAADVAGLMYHNPILVSRLAQYPPYLMLGESHEVQQLGADPDFNNMFMSKADALEILRHPQVQQVLSSPNLVNQLVSADFQDLRVHLETGESPKYGDELILGRWKLDPFATMAQERRRRPNMPASELTTMRKAFEMIAPAITLLATTDQQVVLAADFSSPQPEPEPEWVDPYGQDPYGRYGAPAPQPPPQAPQPPQLQGQFAMLSGSTQGNWERDGFRYRVNLPHPITGQMESVEATAELDRLTLHSPQMTLVFYKD
jgi:hypothetical protein